MRYNFFSNSNGRIIKCPNFTGETIIPDVKTYDILDPISFLKIDELKTTELFYSISITADGNFILTNNVVKNSVKGISKYNLTSKELVWAQPFVEPYFSTQFFKDEKTVLLISDMASLKFIDIETGQMLKPIRGLRKYFDDLNSDFIVLEKTNSYDVVDQNNKIIKKLPKASDFGIRNCVLNKEKLILKDLENPLTCYDLLTGKVLWTQPKIDPMYGELWFNEHENCLTALTWTQKKGETVQTINISIGSGELLNKIELPFEHMNLFKLNDNHIATDNGEIYDLKTGQLKT